jgi:hypothetical protein
MKFVEAYLSPIPVNSNGHYLCNLSMEAGALSSEHGISG